MLIHTLHTHRKIVINNYYIETCSTGLTMPCQIKKKKKMSRISLYSQDIKILSKPRVLNDDSQNYNLGQEYTGGTDDL